jgi:transcriptional regulator with XRE-family HTH domain
MAGRSGALRQQPIRSAADVLGPGGVDLPGASALFGMTNAQLADTAGLARETLQKVERRNAPKTQSRLREMLEILRRIEDWAGGPAQAMAWYRAEPIPAFGQRTAESLVKSGDAAALRDYLDHVATGGYA